MIYYGRNFLHQNLSHRCIHLICNSTCFSSLACIFLEAPQSIVLDSSWKDVIKKLTRYSKIFKRFLKTQMFDLTNRFRSKHFCPHRLRNMFSKVLSKLISWKASVFVGQLSFNRVLLPKKSNKHHFSENQNLHHC